MDEVGNSTHTIVQLQFDYNLKNGKMKKPILL